MHAVPSPTRSSPRYNKNIAYKISYPSYILDIKIRHHHSCMHEHMTQQQCICSHKQFTTSPTCNSPITFIHQTHMQTRLMQGCTMHLYMIPKCMQYHSSTRSSPRCNKHIVCKISHLSYILDIKSVTISHQCMNIWLDAVHMFTQTIHHFITIHLAYMYSPTNHHHLTYIQSPTTFTIQLTYMYSPTTSQSINIYVFTTIAQSINIQFLTFQVKEKIHHIRINIIFDT